MKKEKYTFALPENVAKRLDELSEQESMSKSEMLRRTIALYSYVYREVVEADKKLCVVDQNDQISREIVLS